MTLAPGLLAPRSTPFPSYLASHYDGFLPHLTTIRSLPGPAGGGPCCARLSHHPRRSSQMPSSRSPRSSLAPGHLHGRFLLPPITPQPAPSQSLRYQLSDTLREAFSHTPPFLLSGTLLSQLPQCVLVPWEHLPPTQIQIPYSSTPFSLPCNRKKGP